MACKMAKPAPDLEREEKEPLPDIGRAEILASDDMKPHRIEVPEWGGAVYLRILSGEERADLETRAPKMKALEMLCELIRLTVCDKAGAAMFTPADVAALQKKNSAVLIRLSGAAQRLNALSADDIEELTKN